MNKTLTIKAVEKAIKIPAKNWVGRCYEIAGLLLKHKLVKGKLRYGHWLGPIAKGSIFELRPITHHGWIEDGHKIIDPTRWTFEMVKPYIFYNFDLDEYYDVGGNKLIELNMTPPPTFKDGKEIKLKVNKDIKNFILNKLQHPYVTDAGIFWLSNLPLKELDIYAKEIYQAIDDAGNGAYIPIDNWDLIMKG